MNPKVALSFLAGALASGATVYAVVDGETMELVKDPPAVVEVPELLAHADHECLESVRLVGVDFPTCTPCVTTLGKIENVGGWCCEGAFMPSRVQSCLNNAAALAEQARPKDVVKEFKETLDP